MTVRRKPPTMAFDVSASSRQWGQALERMDKSRRLTLREQNKLLDQIAITQDAERAAALAALQHRLEQARRGRR
jgi:anthranilate phosphoribosyltransferase